MESPHARATYFASALEGEVLYDSWAELEVDPLVDPLVVYFVHFQYRSPLRSFDDSGDHDDEWARSVETVVDWLQQGTDPDAAQKLLRRMQRWEWGAICVEPSAVLRELESRFKLAQCEVDIHRARIPGGIMILCGLLERHGV